MWALSSNIFEHSPTMRIVVTGEPKMESNKRKLDARLDREFENTFPASDPPKITRSNPEGPVTRKPKTFRNTTKQ